MSCCPLESVKGHPFIKVLFAIVYLTSALVTFIIQATLYVSLRPWNPTLYRKINWYLAYVPYSHVTFLVEWWSKSEYDLFIDPDDLKYIGKEHAFVFMNHGKDVDALLSWAVVDHFGVLGNLRAFLKKALAYVPIYGWNLVMEEHVFLQRNWEQDRKSLGDQIGILVDYPSPMWFAIFPDGTRLTQEKLESSKKVAREKGLPELENVLLPRTKGFVAAVTHLRGKVPAVYDFTIAICKNSQDNANLVSLFQGKKICFKIMLKRYLMEELPEDEKELASWLHERYHEKDKLVQNVLTMGEFEPANNSASTQKMKSVWKNFTYVPISRTMSSLLTIVSSAVIILGFFFTYLFAMLMRGDYVQLGIIVAAMVAASIGLEKAIDATRTSKSSAYGKTS